MKERFCRIVRIVLGVKNDSRVPKRAARSDEGRRRVCWRMKASKPREKAGIVSAVIRGFKCSAIHRAYSSKSMHQYVGVDAVATCREKDQLEAAQARPARHLRSLFRPTFPPVYQHRRQPPSHCHCLRLSIDFPWLRSLRYVGSRRGLPRSSCAAMAPGEVCKRRLKTPENGQNC